MAIDWAKLLRQAWKVGLDALEARRGDKRGGTDQPEVLQIKADMRSIVDIHHRQHHNEWLTVESDEAGVEPYYKCLCPGGYGLRVEHRNVMQRRYVPQPASKAQADPATCGSRNPHRLP